LKKCGIGTQPTNLVLDFISISNPISTFECTFPTTTMYQTNIKTRVYDAHETTQAAAKRARTELLQEQENTQHSMDIDASPKKRMEELITRKNDKKMKWSQYECIRKDKRDA
jgi:hypothetical protein